MKYQNVIGIDPDIDKSGVGFLEVATRKLEATTLDFPNLMNYFDHLVKVRKETVAKRHCGS